MSGPNLTLDEAKAYLREDRGGVNLYDHLSEVLLKLLIERPSDATDVFEHLSTTVRQERFNRPTSSKNVESAAETEAVSVIVMNYVYLLSRDAYILKKAKQRLNCNANVLSFDIFMV
jgi:hypothetical protein